MNQPLFIYPHQGLGDQILCSGLFRALAGRYQQCIVATTINNASSVIQMLSDVPNIGVEVYKASANNVRIDAHATLLKLTGMKVLRLGYSGVDFFKDSKKRLDANFYDQAGVDLSQRWDNFRLNRNNDKESLLFDKLVKKGSKYIFLHEDASRGFEIDRSRIPPGVQIVQPDAALAKEFTVFDYLKIIENAWQIHCIESSFCALIESMNLSIPKFAHRYARPEAKADYRHEFTYRSKWEVLL